MIDDILDVFISMSGFALTLVTAWLFLYLYNSKFDARFSKGISAVCIVGTILTILIIMLLLDGLHVPNVIFLLVLGGILLAYLLGFRKGPVATKLFWFFISVVFYAVSQTVSGAFSAAVYGPLIGNQQLSAAQMLTITLVSTVVQGLAFIILGRKKRRNVAGSPLQVFLLTLIPCLLCFILTVWTDYSIRYPGVDRALSMLHFTVSAVIAAITFLVFILYENMLTVFERNLEQRAIAQKASAIERHNEELLMLYDEVGAIRHDMANHILTISALLTERSYDALDKYLAELSETVASTRLAVNTGSKLLDAIIGPKVSLAKAAEIETDMQFNLGNGDMAIASLDLTSLVSNLLDNAVEACQRISAGEGKPFICFKMLYTRGQLLIIVKNATNGVVQMSEGRYLTQKKGDNHGVGMRQIDGIVKKYCGVIERQHNDRVFETLIRMKLPEGRDA